MNSQWAILTKDAIATGLSKIDSDETGHFSFIDLQLNAKGITSLEGDLSTYSALRYIDLSNNMIVDLTPLERMYDLHAMNCSDNKVKKMPDFSDTQKLQSVDLAKNKITTLHPFNMPSVLSLNISHNEVKDCVGFEGAKTTPALRVLDLSQNALVQSKGIERCTNLEVLNLKGNKLTSLDGFAELESLRQLDISDNNIKSINELAHLASLADLRYLATVGGNLAIHPEGSATDAVLPELLILLPQLTHFNDIEISADHREAADALKAERDAEAMAKAAEEAAAVAAAAEEALAAAAAASEE